MKKRTIFSIFLLAVLVFPVFAQREPMPSLAMPTAAASGFGGHHIAYTDNVFSLLVNPAAIVRTNQNSIFSLSASLFSPETTLSMVGPAMKMAEGDSSALNDMASALSQNNGKISLGFSINEFPLSIAWVANGFGFGLWNRTFVNLNIIGTDRLRTEIYEDVMLPIGFAFKIFDFGSMTLDAGVTLKPFLRIRSYESEKVVDLIGGNAVNDFIENLSAPVIVGGALDLGLMYRWGGLSAGFTFNDIFSMGRVMYNIKADETAPDDTNSYYFPFTMNLGLAYELKLLGFMGLTFAADWHNIMNFFNQDDYLNTRNFLLDFSLGAQLTLFKFVYVRVGMNEMLPAVGVGVHLGAIKIDAAYYGKEFGKEPGQLSTAVMELTISIRPEAKKRDWAWSRRPIFGK
jgi:hypothetical protein